MNKTIKYATNGALLIGIGNAIINALNQVNNNQDENTSFNWNECLKAFGKGALVGGAGGLALGAIRDNEMTNILIATGGTSGFIKDALYNYSDNNLSLCSKAQKILKQLHNEFKEYLSEYPSIRGSIIKGTSIHNSDIDIQLKFNNGSGSIESLRDMVESFLNEKFVDRNLIGVRSQNHSIGLIFRLEGEEKRIDIVPMREIENGKGDTFLYSTKSNSIKKTNTEKQLSSLKFTEKQKLIIKLLKGWKLDNELKLSSILIEHIVKRVFKEYSIPRRIDNALFFVIDYIGNNITRIRIIDPANTNNIISDCISYDEKVKLQNFCVNMLSEIEKDDRNIIEYFQ